MTPEQQEVTVLIAGLCLGIAAIGVMLVLGALAFPATSVAGRRLFATGAVVAVTSSLAYLTYATAAAYLISSGGAP